MVCKMRILSSKAWKLGSWIIFACTTTYAMNKKSSNWPYELPYVLISFLVAWPRSGGYGLLISSTGHAIFVGRAASCHDRYKKKYSVSRSMKNAFFSSIRSSRYPAFVYRLLARPLEDDVRLCSFIFLKKCRRWLKWSIRETMTFPIAPCFAVISEWIIGVDTMRTGTFSSS